MSKSRPEKKPVEKTSPLAQPAEQRVLPMQLREEVSTDRLERARKSFSS
jgi:hypothetical protein